MSLFFATYIGRDEEQRHVVRIGTKYPVVYVLDEDNQVFKRGADNSLTLLTAADHAQKPWIRKNIIREIRDHAAFAIANMNANRRKQSRFFAQG